MDEVWADLLPQEVRLLEVIAKARARSQPGPKTDSNEEGPDDGLRRGRTQISSRLLPDLWRAFSEEGAEHRPVV
jgi:hypothetical protein